jgi:hypothetical protein
VEDDLLGKSFLDVDLSPPDREMAKELEFDSLCEFRVQTRLMALTGLTAC